MKTRLLNIYLFALVAQFVVAQQYNFDLKRYHFSEKDQELTLYLRTNSYEALNFFNHSQKDFMVRTVDPISNMALDYDVTKLRSDQLSDLNLKEWHIIVASKDLSNELLEPKIRQLYQKIEQAKLYENVFVNVYTLGNTLNRISTDFSRIPKYESVRDFGLQDEKLMTNFVAMSDIFNDSRQHVICLLTDGKVGDQVRASDVASAEKFLLDKVFEFKGNLLLYPVQYDGDQKSNAFLRTLVDATSHPDDEVSMMDISKLARQKDGTYSRKSEFDFVITAKPNIKKGDTRVISNEALEIICGYRHLKSNKIHSIKVSGNPTMPLESKVLYPTTYTHSIWVQLLVITGLLLLTIVALYLIIPIVNRYLFKKEHVFKYQDIKQAKVSKKDPLTLEEFSCDDDIVVFGEKMMLLDTWKLMNKKEDMEQAKDFGEFFTTNLEGTLFEQHASHFKWAFLSFFSVLFVLIHYLMFTLIRNYTPDVLVHDLADRFHLPVVADHFSIGTFCITLILVGLGVFYFQNKLEHRAYWDLKTIAVPIIFVGLIVPMLYVLISSSLGVARGSEVYLLELVWSLLIAVSIGLVINKPSGYLLMKWILGVVSGALIIFFVMQLTQISALTKWISSGGAMILPLLSAVWWMNHWLGKAGNSTKISFLKILSPEGYAGTKYALDTKTKRKWSIGNNPENDIYIKWLDYDVRNDHCFIEFNKGKWSAYAYNGEILKNGVVVTNGTDLLINDVLALGQSAITQFKFGEADGSVLNGGEQTLPQSKSTQQEAVMEASEPISRIKIKPRN